MRKYLSPLLFTVAACVASAAPAYGSGRGNWLRCDSHHGTGTFWFDPYAHRGHLRLTGHGQWQGNYPIDLPLPCRFVTEGRRGWVCEEPAPGVHPDGRHRVGIDISYGRYLPVAARETGAGGWMIVDDFGCPRD